MKILLIFNREPYDNTDVTWNGRRLASKPLEGGNEILIFLMNDAADMTRDACQPPEGYDQDLTHKKPYSSKPKLRKSSNSCCT